MLREPPDPRLLHDIYIDESSQTKHRFLVLGGLILPEASAQEFEDRILQARLPELPRGELAWTKVSPAKLSAYSRVVEAALRWSPLTSRVEFHCLAVDTHKIRDHVFNKGSRDIGFNKEIYQLCQKFGRIRKDGLFHVYLDRRNTASTTQELRDILNHGARLKSPARDWPYRRVHFRDSHACQLLQVTDILLGAVAHRLNRHHEAPGASVAKRTLSEQVLTLGAVRDVTRDTSVRGRFTIWHRQLR